MEIPVAFDACCCGCASSLSLFLSPQGICRKDACRKEKLVSLFNHLPVQRGRSLEAVGLRVLGCQSSVFNHTVFSSLSDSFIFFSLSHSLSLFLSLSPPLSLLFTLLHSSSDKKLSDVEIEHKVTKKQIKRLRRRLSGFYYVYSASRQESKFFSFT